MPLKVPIIYYHKIAQPPPEARDLELYVTPANFAAQMRYLHRRKYHTLDLSDLGRALRNEIKLPPRPVIITFDDGYVNNYENAVPVLQQYNLKATIFIVADLIGKKVAWQQSIEVITDPLMSWEQIREIQRGGITIGSHTCTHPKLSQIPAEQARQELVESKSKLEEGLGITVDSFCYPYGRFYNQEVVNLVQEAGYTAACITEKGSLHRPGDVYTLRRIPVRLDTPLWRFAYFMTNLFAYEKERKRRRKEADKCRR